jgi:hypothetical protein
MAEVTIPPVQPAPEPVARGTHRLVAAPLPAGFDDEEPAWAGAEDDADLYEPVAAPAPRPRQARDDLEDERPLLAQDHDHDHGDHLLDDEDEDEDVEPEDSYLAELRKAMTDDEPLGPRDDGDDDDYGAPVTGARSRFGRRR